MEFGRQTITQSHPLGRSLLAHDIHNNYFPLWQNHRWHLPLTGQSQQYNEHRDQSVTLRIEQI